MNPSPIHPSFRGAHFAAAAVVSVPGKDRALEVDHAYIAAVAEKPDALRLVQEHHGRRHTIASRGVIEAVRARVHAFEQFLATGEESCRRLADGLALLTPNRVVPGGDQPRTLAVQFNIAGALVIAFATVACDWLLLRSLAREVTPEYANDPVWLWPLAFPVIASTAALKFFAVLRYRDAGERAAFEKNFARLLLWVLPVMLLCLAKRLAGWAVNPVDSMLGETNAAMEMAITVGAFLLQLGSQAVVGAAALCTAEKLANTTRPSSSQPSEHYQGLKQQLDAEAKMLDSNQTTLGGLRAMLAELEGERAAFLAEAEAALLAEQLELKATEHHLAAMRSNASRTSPLSTPINGRRFSATSTTN